jgi:antitoxin component YwqK of YwqJK toxin-antitoxin module
VWVNSSSVMMMGSLRAKSTTVDGVPEGYWEWFRKDGSEMRSGYFQSGKQTGKWTTYDKHGVAVKVTAFDRKTKRNKSVLRIRRGAAPGPVSKR